MRELKTPLESWAATGGASVARDPQGRLVFSDGAATSAHAIRFAHADLRGAMVELAIVVHPLPGCSTDLMVQHPGSGIIMCQVSPAGRVSGAGMATRQTVTRRADGALVLDIAYFSGGTFVVIGTAKPHPRYQGSGQPQYAFESISVSIAPAELPAPEARFTVVDIGADNRFAPLWRRLAPNVVPFAMPRPTADATILREDVAAFPGGRVQEAVLYSKKGRRKLNRTATPLRSSLLTTEKRTLRKLPDATPFEVLEQVPVDCVRYDDLYAAGTAPAPDALRLEAQGTEYEVLQGFGALLDGCLSVQVRCAFYPIFKGQKLLPEIATLLDRHDLVMNILSPIRQSGIVLEALAWFTKTDEWAAAQPEPVRQRLAAIRAAFAL